MRYMISVASALALAACATVGPPAVPDSIVPLAASDGIWALEDGDNRIEGNAVLRTQGGDVRTCAGYQAELVPATPYGEDRLRIIYGSTVRGYNPVSGPRRIVESVPEYQRLVRTTVCDSQGNFLFEDLPDGIYYISTTVAWSVPMQYYTSQEGGILMQRVELEGGETKRVVLTH